MERIRKIEKEIMDFIERIGLFEKATLLPWHSSQTNCDVPHRLGMRVC
jgi:hypothetical protein